MTKQVIEMQVVDLVNNPHGYDYFLALGPDGMQHKVTNVIKFQHDNVPEKIYAFENGADRFGKRYKQDIVSILKEHYQIDNYYKFKIRDCRPDVNDVWFYEIEDDFAVQNWYPKTNDIYDILDEIILKADGYNNSGFVTYVDPKNIQQIPTTNTTVPSATISGEYPIFNGGDEDLHTEYKTSIVFSAKTSTADIDAQCYEIVREIAGFMNAEGGTLYIGIKDDTHEIVGIENDFTHLNEGVEDKFADSYKPNTDHYALKIKNVLRYLTSSRAGANIDITFPQQDGVTYCKIYVKADDMPVWMKNNILYQRQGNSTPPLSKDDISFFIFKRMQNRMPSSVDFTLSPDELAEKMLDSFKTAINSRREDIAWKPKGPDEKQAKEWIIWYNDRSWKRQKNKETSDNVLFQYPKFDDSKDLIVVLCYKSGTVNIVEYSTFNKKTKMNILNRDKGYSKDETPIGIFLCRKTDLIAVYAADQGGDEYVKVHRLTDFGTTQSAINKGSYIIPTTGAHILQCKLVPAAQATLIGRLIASKKETTTLKWNINDITVKDAIEHLKEV